MLLDTGDKGISILCPIFLGCKTETQFPSLISGFKSIHPAHSCHHTVVVLKWARCQSLLKVDYLAVHNRHLEWFYYLLFSMLSYCGNPSKVVPQLGFSFFGFCFCTLEKKSKKYCNFVSSNWGLGVLSFSFGHFCVVLSLLY